MSDVEFLLEDGFLAMKVTQGDLVAIDHAKTIIDLIVQGKRQCETGQLELNSLEAAKRYEQFMMFMLTTENIKPKEMLFDLLTFSGNYLRFWEWLKDRVIDYQSRKNMGDLGP